MVMSIFAMVITCSSSTSNARRLAHFLTRALRQAQVSASKGVSTDAHNATTHLQSLLSKPLSFSTKHIRFLSFETRVTESIPCISETTPPNDSSLSEWRRLLNISMSTSSKDSLPFCDKASRMCEKSESNDSSHSFTGSRCSGHLGISEICANMATSSHLLPQALHMIPRIPTFSSKNLGVSSILPRASSSKSRLSVSTNHSSSNFGFAIDSKKRREFIVRAEESTEGETEAVVENAVEAEAEAAVAEEEAKPPRKTRVKLGDIMGLLNKKAIEVAENIRPVPGLRTGDIVEIKLEVPENKRRLSIYKGIVMSRQNAGIHTTIRIRRIIAGIGVEIVFPIYSPNIKEIKVVSHRKVRRARLYYLRDKLPRLSTFK